MAAFRLPLALSLLILLTALNSCKKLEDNLTGSNGDYYITFKAGTAAYNYQNGCLAHLAPTAGIYEFSGAGLEDLNVTDANYFNLFLSDSSEITTAVTYTDYSTTQANTLKADFLQLVWVNSAGETYVSAGGLAGYTSDNQIRFSSVSDKSLEGTFSGTVYAQSSSSIIQNYVISEGKFKLKRY